MIVWKRGDVVGVSFTDIAGDVAPVVTTYVSSHRPLDPSGKN